MEIFWIPQNVTKAMTRDQATQAAVHVPTDQPGRESCWGGGGGGVPFLPVLVHGSVAGATNNFSAVCGVAS